MTLPDGYRFVHLPPPLAVEHPCFSAHRDTSTQGQHARMSFELAVRCSMVSIDDYADFRQAAQKLISSFQDEIVFAKRR